MTFQILTLIVWPKDKRFAPRPVEFQLGKLNVITGASRTGKSAIIPIIDYCLASSDCFIPIDTIRDFSSWYGVILQTANDQVLIARRVPQGNKVSNDFYLLRGKVISFPAEINNPNETIDGIKFILNAITSVPYFSLDSDDTKKAYQARLGFRDLVAFVFQNQDIVANQNILFYKTHAHEHRERLRNWFPYILGAENIEILAARQKMQEIERRLSQLKREFEKAKAVSDSWMVNMVGHIKVAKEYGLVNKQINVNTTPAELLHIAKEIIEDIPEFSKTNINDVTGSNKEIAELELEEVAVSNEISIVKKRLNDLRNLKAGLVDYGNSLRKRADRLRISKWLKDVGQNSEACPACGSLDHPNSRVELAKISTVFEKYENEASAVAVVPTSFDREEQALNNELEVLLERKKNYQYRFDLVTSKDKQAREQFQSRKNMFLFLGHLRSSTETFESLVEGGNYQKNIDTLQDEYNNLLRITDSNGVKRRVEVAAAKISQGILTHLKTLDVEDKYRKIAPKFDIKDLNISVLSNDDHWHYLAEVGSASNWVSFHLALMCSLQEYFIEMTNSSVPSFVIFDQPSQVYFPKLKKQTAEENLDPAYGDEDDVEAVKSMFKTIANSIKTMEGSWQGIILDHADDTIYGEIEGVHEVEVWRNGKKLIPMEWYSPTDEESIETR